MQILITDNVIKWLENQGSIADKKISSFRSKTKNKKRIPVDGKLHPIYTEEVCKILDDMEIWDPWVDNLHSDPYTNNLHNLCVSANWANYAKKIKSKIKKNSNTTLSDEINYRYNFILKKLINLEKKLPGFGPNNICANKKLARDIDKINEIKFFFDELGIYDATFKHFKINRVLDDPSLEAWDGFVKKNGDKLFNILNFIMPLKKEFYEFIIKDKNKQKKEDEERRNSDYMANIIVWIIYAVLSVLLLAWCSTGFRMPSHFYYD